MHGRRRPRRTAVLARLDAGDHPPDRRAVGRQPRRLVRPGLPRRRGCSRARYRDQRRGDHHRCGGGGPGLDPLARHGRDGGPVRELRVRRPDRDQRPDDRARHRRQGGRVRARRRVSPVSGADLRLDDHPRAAAAILLVIGAARSLRRESPPLPPTFLVIAPAVVLVLSGDHAVRPRSDPAAGSRRRGLRPERAGRCSACRRSRPRSCSSRWRSSSAFIVAAILYAAGCTSSDGLVSDGVPVGRSCRRRVRPAAFRARPGRRVRDRDLDRAPAPGLLRDPA